MTDSTDTETWTEEREQAEIHGEKREMNEQERRQAQRRREGL